MVSRNRESREFSHKRVTEIGVGPPNIFPSISCALTPPITTLHTTWPSTDLDSGNSNNGDEPCYRGSYYIFGNVFERFTHSETHCCSTRRPQNQYARPRLLALEAQSRKVLSDTARQSEVSSGRLLSGDTGAPHKTYVYQGSSR